MWTPNTVASSLFNFRWTFNQLQCLKRRWPNSNLAPSSNNVHKRSDSEWTEKHFLDFIFFNFQTIHILQSFNHLFLSLIILPHTHSVDVLNCMTTSQSFKVFHYWIHCEVINLISKLQNHKERDFRSSSMFELCLYLLLCFHWENVCLQIRRTPWESAVEQISSICEGLFCPMREFWFSPINQLKSLRREDIAFRCDILAVVHMELGGNIRRNGKSAFWLFVFMIWIKRDRNFNLLL